MTQKRKIGRTNVVQTKKPVNDMRFLNLSTYTSPKITEVRNRDWVSYGEDNNYFQFLIDRYNGSPTNNAIINGISEMIYGRGLDATDSNRKPDQYAQTISLFKKDCVRKLAYDLKLMGQCAIQVIYSKDRTKVAQVEHMPVETLRAEKANSKGEIEAYYYAHDWTKLKPSDKPKRIPAFGHSQGPIEIMYIKPYKAGFYYYSPVDYQGGIQYAELEEEISNYHLNNIMNGLAPSMLINFNNGVPNEEERNLLEQKIYQKYSGTNNAGKFILAFNDDPNQAATIETIQLSDAHNQYQFLSDESMRKIMVAHRVVSPMLLGIKDSTGLGNNADELKTATILMDNTVIRPFQTLLLDAFDEILAYNHISLNLYFKTLQPLEFTDLENVNDAETKEEETGIKENLSKDDRPFLDDETADELWDLIKDLGEDDLEGYELVDSEDVGDEPEDFDAEKYLNGLNLSATEKSSQDTDFWKVRYKYVKGTNKIQKGNSRQFCTNMLSADKLYRKEDISQMSAQGVNRKFGHKGRNYSLFKFKGGVNCYHRWERRIYKKKETKDGQPYGGDSLRGTYFVNVNEAIRRGFRPEKNPKEVAIAPIDMPNNGHHPNYMK
jgi:hypothetical protein